MLSTKNISILALIAVLAITGCKKDKSDGPLPPAGPYRAFEKLDFNVELPHQINILFQIKDQDGIGIPDLPAEAFEVKEDNMAMGSESEVTIKPTNQVEIEIKTLLFIDNSKSLEQDLDKVKEAAINLINLTPEYQKIALYTFSSNIQQLTELTNNKETLIEAVKSIQTGIASTNLYGAMVKAGNANIWNDHYSIDSLRTANMIMLTDGNDTQGSVPREDALEAMKNKTCYMLGLGTELDPTQLKAFGNYYAADNIDELQKTFTQIQMRIESTAKSFYWMFYQSPKRGNYDHLLKITFKENTNTSSSAYIEETFNSYNFTDE